jgi:hypothetical protein
MRSARGAGIADTLSESQSDTTKEKKCNRNLCLKCSLYKESNSVYTPCSIRGGLKNFFLKTEKMDQDSPDSVKNIDIYKRYH